MLSVSAETEIRNSCEYQFNVKYGNYEKLENIKT